jgi:acetoin utilization deacetylase AcuC-like enzyme
MSDENQSLPNDQLIRSREHTSTYSYELDVLHPAPQATRHTIPPVPLRNLDEDTSVSAFSWFAALFAGGTVIDSVKRVISGQYKNAFCAVRPPGHHSGPTGLVSTDENIGDSHGFCLLNNVAIGAAHAKALYPDLIKRVAIIDFDVHHGNGTESIVQKLRPQLLQRTVHIPQTAQSVGIDKICLTRQVYSPWNDCQDVDQVLFASVHGYHKAQGDQFYPGTGSNQ